MGGGVCRGWACLSLCECEEGFLGSRDSPPGDALGMSPSTGSGCIPKGQLLEKYPHQRSQKTAGFECIPVLLLI